MELPLDRIGTRSPGFLEYWLSINARGSVSNLAFNVCVSSSPRMNLCLGVRRGFELFPVVTRGRNEQAGVGRWLTLGQCKQLRRTRKYPALHSKRLLMLTALVVVPVGIVRMGR